MVTYYQQEFLRIRATVFPHQRVCDRVVTANAYADTHFGDATLCLRRMAAVAAVSPFHFLRLFVRLYGRTPRRYLQEVRVARAKALLMRGASVRETCEAVGFKSIPSFTLLFRRMTGATPATFVRRETRNSG